MEFGRRHRSDGLLNPLAADLLFAGAEVEHLIEEDVLQLAENGLRAAAWRASSLPPIALMNDRFFHHCRICKLLTFQLSSSRKCLSARVVMPSPCSSIQAMTASFYAMVLGTLELGIVMRNDHTCERLAAGLLLPIHICWPSVSKAQSKVGSFIGDGLSFWARICIWEGWFIGQGAFNWQNPLNQSQNGGW